MPEKKSRKNEASGTNLAQYYVCKHRPTLFSFKNNLYIGKKVKWRHFDLSDYIFGKGKNII